MSVDNITRVIEHYCEDSEDDLQLEGMDIVTDQETNEEFLEVVVSTSAEMPQEKVPQFYVRPVFQAYARLVVDANLDYPLEAVASVRVPGDRERRLPFGAFRTSVMWVREHSNGNLTLEQTLHLALQTLQRPESQVDAVNWIPEYPDDWRQLEAPDADSFPAGVSYDYWAGRSVSYPGSESES
jgi:hypothetical protein